MVGDARTYRGVTYRLHSLLGEGSNLIAVMTSWGGQRCRLTTVKRTSGDATSAAERWIDRALAERSNPEAPTYRWVADPEELLVGGFVCAQMGEGEPVLVLE